MSKLISEEYRKLNQQLHKEREDYGSRQRLDMYDDVLSLMALHDCRTVLDYGCGKATMSKFINGVTNYDPCIKEYSAPATPHDLIVCADVLEHIEPELLDHVLADIISNANKAIYLVIATRTDTTKTLPDGRNPHLIVEPGSWWLRKIKALLPSWKINALIDPTKGEVKIKCLNDSSF
jgi:hypothetical protein